MHLDQLIREEMAVKGKSDIISLCIGIDRFAGDSLGSLVGHVLRSRRLKGVVAIEALDKPAHTMNLGLCVRYIRFHCPDYVMVATDTSMGGLDHVRYTTLGRGAFRPGLGVSEELRTAGDIAITGIVGGVGSRDLVMLQSVRLPMVMKTADCIRESIPLAERLWESAAVIWQILRRESIVLAWVRNSGVVLWENYMNLLLSYRRVSGRQVRGIGP